MLFQVILPLAIIFSVFLLAAMVARWLGVELEQPGGAVSEQEEQWLKELAVLQLEERHRVC
jgi:uncharacterized membrane protein